MESDRIKKEKKSENIELQGHKELEEQILTELEGQRNFNSGPLYWLIAFNSLFLVYFSTLCILLPC